MESLVIVAICSVVASLAYEKSASLKGIGGNDRPTVLLSWAVGVGAKARTNGKRSVGVGGEDSSGSDSRWWRDLRHARWVDYRCGVDSGHPDADLVLLEQVCDELVEIDVGLSIVEVSELVVITRMC